MKTGSAGMITDDRPWVVKADGEQLACVGTKEEADSVIFGLRLKYAKTIAAQLSSDMKEDVSIERAPLRAYRQSEMSDVTEAVASIERRNGSKDPPVTVVTTETVNDERTIERPVRIVKRPDIRAGEIEVRSEGHDGKEQVVSEVTLENGDISAVKEIENVTESAPESAVVYEGTAPDGKELGELVIDCAVRFLGTKYVWGGNDLRNGIDCSGFTKEIYAMFGIELPRHSSAQAKFGEEVAYKDARAGDIVCYDGHVALYIGDGKIIHATPGRIQFGENAAYRQILTVRRVFTDDGASQNAETDFEEMIEKLSPNENEDARSAAKERDEKRAERSATAEDAARKQIERILSDRHSTMTHGSE